MKKFLLTILAAGSIVAANAQEGTILGYGNLDFNTAKDAAKNTTTNFSIMPGIGYQFNNNWTVGLAGGFGSNVYKTDAGDKADSNFYQIGAFLRYTKVLNSTFSVFGQLDVFYMGGKTKYTPSGGSTVDGPKTSGFGAMLTPAVSINIPKWFALNFSVGGLGYMTNTTAAYGGAPSATANQFALTFGQQFNIGISKNFGCGHHMHGHHEPGEEMRHMDTSDDDDSAPKAKHHNHKSKKSKKDKDNDNDDE